MIRVRQHTATALQTLTLPCQCQAGHRPRNTGEGWLCVQQPREGHGTPSELELCPVSAPRLSSPLVPSACSSHLREYAPSTTQVPKPDTGCLPPAHPLILPKPPPEPLQPICPVTLSPIPPNPGHHCPSGSLPSPCHPFPWSAHHSHTHICMCPMNCQGNLSKTQV